MNVDRVVRRALIALGVRSRFVDSGVARHHVYDAAGRGRLPPIVLLPGLSDSGSSLAPVLLALRRQARRVLIVESAGHGLSSQARGEHTVEVHFAALTAALDAVLDEPALLVGNSLGGATALRYAADRPGRVRGLFLTSPAGARYGDAELAAVRDAFRFGSVADARAFLDRVVHRRSPLAGALARVVYARSRSPGIADIVRSAGAEHALAPDQLARIDAPIRLVWGRSERLLPATALAYWKASLPGHATVVEPDGFGHCPHLDAPLRLARLIAGFARAVHTTA